MKIRNALQLLVAGTLMSLISVGSAGAVPTTWDFTTASDSLLPHSQTFTATDLSSQLTALAFSYTTGPNATTNTNLYLELQPGSVSYLGVCSILNAGGTDCLSGGSGDFTGIDNLGPDEFLQLQFGAPWALVKVVLNNLDAGDQWYLYGNSSSDFFGSTLLASAKRNGDCGPGPSGCSPTITDPFGIIDHIDYDGDSHSRAQVYFNVNAENHAFKNYFIAADVNPTGQSNDTFGLASFTGEVAASVSEPATIALLGIGLGGLGWIARRRR